MIHLNWQRMYVSTCRSHGRCVSFPYFSIALRQCGWLYGYRRSITGWEEDR